ncbi:hypothetical protein GCM10017600_37490 [Streptosporangium carneum]|uniref:Uncharacterized protein n=1 Tax=Streptosporangium carneum TaxID=47481 RepID=A0A9W6I368_9ACTN|nr:hypothetical protein GCM10017600_37490 [Streptosporangium carneum]
MQILWRFAWLSEDMWAFSPRLCPTPAPPAPGRDTGFPAPAGKVPGRLLYPGASRNGTLTPSRSSHPLYSLRR